MEALFNNMPVKHYFTFFVGSEAKQTKKNKINIELKKKKVKKSSATLDFYQQLKTFLHSFISTKTTKKNNQKNKISLRRKKQKYILILIVIPPLEKILLITLIINLPWSYELILRLLLYKNVIKNYFYSMLSRKLLFLDLILYLA